MLKVLIINGDDPRIEPKQCHQGDDVPSRFVQGWQLATVLMRRSILAPKIIGLDAINDCIKI